MTVRLSTRTNRSLTASSPHWWRPRSTTSCRSTTRAWSSPSALASSSVWIIRASLRRPLLVCEENAEAIELLVRLTLRQPSALIPTSPCQHSRTLPLPQVRCRLHRSTTRRYPLPTAAPIPQLLSPNLPHRQSRSFPAKSTVSRPMAQPLESLAHIPPPTPSRLPHKRAFTVSFNASSSHAIKLAHTDTLLALLSRPAAVRS